MQPQYKIDSSRLGDLMIKLMGEDWGKGLQDTAVKIEAGQICWVCWANKDAFMKELNEVISKYRI